MSIHDRDDIRDRLRNAREAAPAQWTKTEALRRLKVAAGLARAADRGIARNARVELGARQVPEYLAAAADHTDKPEDDLDEFWATSSTVRWMPAQVLGVGYVAHLYFTNAPGTDAEELFTVITVWLGDGTHEPELVHVP